MLSCSPSEDADEAWLSIAELGGEPQWLLRKECGFVLLRIHALTKTTRKGIMACAERAGLVSPAPAYRGSSWDSERQERIFSLYRSTDEAREEVEDLEKPRVVRVKVHEATSSLVAYWQARHGQKSIDLLDVSDAATACPIDRRFPDIDGLLWDDILDESALSAPRVGLFPRTVASLRKEPIAA